MKSYFGFILIVCCVNASIAASVAKPTCGAKASTKTIQLLTPAYPPRECVYHINSYSKYVCQLRIDFGMTLAQPSLPSATNELKYAECQTDYLEVAGMRFCGTEVNTHIYVPFNVSAGETNVDILFSLAARVGATSLPVPSWEMTVTQLECPTGAALRSFNTFAEHEDIESPLSRATSFSDGYFLAPPGCLQYYPQSKGAIQSFNFNNGKGIYPGGMNYAICFRRTAKTIGLELRSFFFQLSSAHGDAAVMALDSYCYPSHYTGADNEDYLMVPQGEIEEGHIRGTYFCGNTLEQGLTITSSNPGPLMVVFNSDGVSSENEVGFDFNFKLL